MLFERTKVEEWIRSAVDRVPPSIQRRIENVAFILEDRPRHARRGEFPIVGGGLLLGLYRGVPLTRRGGNYTMVPPDTITIFQEAIEQVAGPDESAVRRQVQKTVWHEIAHYLGMDEKEVRAWERRQP